MSVSDCKVKECINWISNKSTDPYSGHCADERILACHKEQMSHYIISTDSATDTPTQPQK